jgi:hypothetical protein
MQDSYTNKVALVTGGTSGIGKEGAAVVAEIQHLGGTAAFVRADVAEDADVKAMVDFTVATYGRLDVAFNNTRVEWMGSLVQATEAEYRVPPPPPCSIAPSKRWETRYANRSSLASPLFSTSVPTRRNSPPASPWSWMGAGWRNEQRTWQ